MRLLLRWVVTAAALWVTITVLHAIDPQMATWRAGAGGALLAVLVMAVVNAVIRPIVKLLTLPLSCLTFGLFSFVINALMFLLVANLTHAFRVSFVGALLGSILMSLVSGIANFLIVGPEEVNHPT
jgi:putative membrane protein